MPGSDPETNGDLSADIRQLENALARCASQVKMIKHCQDENDAQTRQPAQGADCCRHGAENQSRDAADIRG
ncbi:phage lysis protein [Escherichia coli]|nr:phage lysis protein [Escherichia coli]